MDDERLESRRIVNQPRPKPYILASEVTTVEVKSPGQNAHGSPTGSSSPSAADAAPNAPPSSGAAGQKQGHFVSQWTSLARHGRLGPTHGHMFEIEPLTTDEKVLTLVLTLIRTRTLTRTRTRTRTRILTGKKSGHSRRFLGMAYT